MIHMPHPGTAPKTIGDFEILSELGRGGMGVVYEAKQKSLNRRVALKVLSSGLGLTAKAVMRFKREAEAAAKVHHTNIVPIFSTGEDGRIPYYVMELIEGPSLDRVIHQMKAQESGLTEQHEPEESAANVAVCPDWVAETFIATNLDAHARSVTDTTSGLSDSPSTMRSGPDLFDNLAAMMADVASALAHAHDEGVIHRDIKPSNLLLSQDGRLSVTDFGLARMLEQPGMTVSGEFMGTPRYMSPEQIASGRIPLDHRTDIYSLGAVLYELITLQPLFDGQQRDLVLSQIIHKEPVRPRKAIKRIPQDLETICQQGQPLPSSGLVLPCRPPSFCGAREEHGLGLVA